MKLGKFGVAGGLGESYGFVVIIADRAAPSATTAWLSPMSRDLLLLRPVDRLSARFFERI